MIDVEVISGEEEARLAYLAAISGLGVGHGVARCVRHRRRQLAVHVRRRDEWVDERFSVNVGAVRFTERFGLDGVVPDDVLGAALEAISADLARLDGRPTPDALVGMGGAVTNLAAVKHELATYDPDVVQGAVLDRAEIDRQIELYRTRTASSAAASSACSPSGRT